MSYHQSGCTGLLPTEKLSAFRADHLPLSGVKGTNVWSCNSPLPYAFVMCVGLILAMFYCVCDHEVIVETSDIWRIISCLLVLLNKYIR